MMVSPTSSSLFGKSADGEAPRDNGDVGVLAGRNTGGSFSDEGKARTEEGERGGGIGGNRWPRQETLALLKIRSEMGISFRDSNLKGPLWEEVSRKMAQLGYRRNAKKCKEKFENVYKYHKRTKDGRAAKADGKTYRFFEELKALETCSPCPISTLPLRLLTLPPPPPLTTTAAVSFQHDDPIFSHVSTVLSAANAVPPVSTFSPFLSAILPVPSQPHSMNPRPKGNYNGCESSHPPSILMSDSTSSSMSTSSDEDMDMGRRRKRKMDFLERLMNDVMRKQEVLQKKFLETLEKRERDRAMREEAWRVQEMARMNRELDRLAQERSMAAAKDRAMMALLQKMIGQKSPSSTNNDALLQVPQNPPVPPTTSAAMMPINVDRSSVIIKDNIISNVGENLITPSPPRWPKTEVEALINLRTNLDVKYSDNVPKGPLWEEISAEMKKLGYNRSAKRCKEKWENINKYYKKMKENCTNSKKRPEDSKTCPYFLQLDALYTRKPKILDPSSNSCITPPIPIPKTGGLEINPMMVRQEQHWPLPQGQEPAAGEEEVDDEQGQGAYEIVTNTKTATSATVLITE